MKAVLVLPDRYRFLKPLGRGGMGRVLVAWDEELGRRVALKLLDLAPTPELRGRVEREARLLVRLRAPQLPEVYDFDAHCTRPWIAMELIEGATLEDVPLRDPLPVYLEVARALAVCHAGGVLHRDVKPSNVLLEPRGRVVLVDFGLAQGRGDLSLTATGIYLGTPGFMAPELLRLAEATPASDVYAWAVSLFYALEERLPFPEGSGPDAAPLHFERVPSGDPLRVLLARCLATDPARRPASAGELVRRIEALERGGEGAPEHATARRTQATLELPMEARATEELPASAEAPEPQPERRPERSQSAMPAVGGLAALGLVAWLGSGALVSSSLPPGLRPQSAASPAPRAEVPSPPGEADPRRAGPPRGDLVAELHQAVAAEESGAFREAYAMEGAGAYPQLPGQRAWSEWIDAGGRSEQLGVAELQRLRTVNAEAERLGLVAPFGPGWIRPDPGGLPEDPDLAIKKIVETCRLSSNALEELVQSNPYVLPGATEKPPSVIGPWALVEVQLAAVPGDHPAAAELDRFLQPYRWTWLRTAALGARLLASVPEETRLHRLGELAEELRITRHTVAGSISGVRARQVLGFRPDLPEAAALEVHLSETLAQAAATSGRLPAETDRSRVESWRALSGRRDASLAFRVRAWLQGLRIAGALEDWPLFRSLDEERRGPLELALDPDWRRWLEVRRRAAVGAAEAP